MLDDLHRLRPAEIRVAQQLVRGLTNLEIAAELGTSLATVNGHLGTIGRRFRVSSRPARAHAVLASGQVSPPAATVTSAVFTEADRRLLSALAIYDDTYAIAHAAGIAPASIRRCIRDLVTKAGANNDTHLIGLAHTWGMLLRAEGGGPVVSGGRR
ncbi:helix-turn-helix transcriptional regulator (plasmid) [Actinacidiphila glaucinigra]|uniref:helix-turn-helix domain-containing protein n=1 Tax=Actinacidiphila glaucinigra TaxID=235986 RepID=UPI002DD875FC|nr:helix-turn-helix transcriptional regulator [Actinacidiphila glaucinigra]WSD65811.1 helix-turn-helix transcriptional regulator [Actinacidiphila glaucinigra]